MIVAPSRRTVNEYPSRRRSLLAAAAAETFQDMLRWLVPTVNESDDELIVLASVVSTPISVLVFGIGIGIGTGSGAVSRRRIVFAVTSTMSSHFVFIDRYLPYWRTLDPDWISRPVVCQYV